MNSLPSSALAWEMPQVMAGEHDQRRNGRRQLNRLLVDAVGCRPALEAIIG
jgi:hypothetical protein